MGNVIVVADSIAAEFVIVSCSNPIRASLEVCLSHSRPFEMSADTGCPIAEPLTFSFGISCESAKSALRNDPLLLDENTHETALHTSVRAVANWFHKAQDKTPA